MREISEIEKNIEVENKRLLLGMSKLSLFLSEARRFKSEYQSTNNNSEKKWLARAYNTIFGFAGLNTVEPLFSTVFGGIVYYEELPTVITHTQNNKIIDTGILGDYEPRYRPVLLEDGKYDVEPTRYTTPTDGVYNCILDFVQFKDGYLDTKYWENKQREKVRILVDELMPVIETEQVLVKDTTEKIIEEQATHTIYSIQESKRARRISQVVLVPLFVLLIITTYITFIK